MNKWAWVGLGVAGVVGAVLAIGPATGSPSPPPPGPLTLTLTPNTGTQGSDLTTTASVSGGIPGDAFQIYIVYPDGSIGGVFAQGTLDANGSWSGPVTIVALSVAGTYTVTYTDETTPIAPMATAALVVAPSPPPPATLTLTVGGETGTVAVPAGTTVPVAVSGGTPNGPLNVYYNEAYYTGEFDSMGNWTVSLDVTIDLAIYATDGTTGAVSNIVQVVITRPSTSNSSYYPRYARNAPTRPNSRRYGSSGNGNTVG